jgi:cobyrinic acid a,c-diamide synthase
MRIPRIIISGLSGGAGKTMVSLGLARALLRSGQRVRAFKKGPDYIDAAWLALAARSPQANLDPFFLSAPALRRLFQQGAGGFDIALIEGNRGLFDGLDLRGSCSTAELARLLLAPVLLVLDCSKMTRTVAALVSGCLHFEQGLHIGGVILNRTGNPRHHAMARRAVEELAGVPVFGALPRRPSPFIRERHMGLAGLDEYARADENLDALADFMGDHVDLAAVARLAASAPALPEDAADGGAEADHAPELSAGDVGRRLTPSLESETPASGRELRSVPHAGIKAGEGPCIGYVHDAAFWFYYEENLAALRAAGATLLPLSLLDGERREGDGAGEDAGVWDRLDGLYIGGGQPELYARELSGNSFLRETAAALARSGLPIYAECGGFMYLAGELRLNGENFPMAGVFPLCVELLSRPQGLGYVEAEVVTPNPYHPLGTHFRGHEFHFSRCLPLRDGASPGAGALSADGHVLHLHRGRGMCSSPDQEGFDGLLFHNTFAAYTHVYAPALPHWAGNFVTLCADWKKRRRLRA